MWSFFVALFGGTYWAYKVGSDKAASRRADDKNFLMRCAQEKWTEQTRDYELEVQIRNTSDNAEYQKQYQEAIELIRTLPGLEKANFRYGKSSFYVSQMVLYIQMVKRGKLLSGYQSQLGNFLELSIDKRPTKKARIEFGKWVENSLKNAGVMRANLYYTKKNYASFEWEPYIYDLSKAIRITDPNLESQMIGFD